MHWFVAGIFVATALAHNILLLVMLAALLLMLWGDYILPLLVAIFIDITFVDIRNLANVFGFIFTVITLLITLLLLPLRRFLKF